MSRNTVNILARSLKGQCRPRTLLIRCGFSATIIVTVSLLLVALPKTSFLKSTSPAVGADVREAVIVQAAGLGKGVLNPRDGRALKAEYHGSSELSTALRTGFAQPLALATADFDGDGAPDLVTGYQDSGAGIITLQRGNIDAFAPKDRTVYDRAANGELPPSFLPQAELIELPEPANFILTNDINEDGRKDLIVAARGGGLYVLKNDGHGTFGTPERLELPGKVTALTSGTFGHADGWRAVLVGIVGAEGPALALFNQDTNGLSRTPSITRLPAEATSLVLGSFDDDPYFDLGIAAGQDIIIVHGQKPAAPISDGKPIDLQERMEQIEVGFEVRGLAAGTFVPDIVPRMDLAALSADGTIHLWQRSKANTAPAVDLFTEMAGDSAYEIRDEIRKGFLEQVKASARVPMWQAGGKQEWAEVRQLDVSITAPGADASQSLLQTARISGRRADDLLLVDGNNRQVRVLVDDGLGQLTQETGAAQSSRVPVTFDVDSAPVAALAMPQKINGERDLMILSAGHTAPSASIVPLAAVNLTVNNVTDQIRNPGNLSLNCGGNAGDCSLREAVLKANLNAGPNTINVPGNLGTYNLSVNNPNNPGGTGTIALPDLEIGSATNTNTTVVGITGTPHIHQTIALNDVITTGFTTLPFPANAADVTLSLQNLEITGGTFTGIFTGADDGAGHIANTTITNSNVHNNTNGGQDASGTFGQGGALQNQCGTLSIQTSTFANNAATNANTAQGGAIYYSIVNAAGQCSTGDLTVNNSTFTSNNAHVQAGFPAGGALFVSGGGSNAIPITGTKFTSNTADGGGDGGALASTTATRTVNVTTNTFDANSVSHASGRGGAISGNSGPLNVNFNRFVGNTATTTQNGKVLFRSGSTFNANNNWWGINAGPDTSCGAGNPCDVNGTITTAIWLQLRNVCTGANVHNTNQIAPSSSCTFTADILGLNTGGSTSAANLVGLDVFPNSAITIYSNPALGTTSGPTTGQYTNGIAPGITYNAGAVKGTGSLDATVDSQTVTGNVKIGFDPEYVNPAGGTDVNTAFASAVCGAGNTPCFQTIGLALFNVFPTGLIHIQTGTYAETPNFDQNCTTQIDGAATLNALTLTNGTFSAQSFTTTLASGNFTNNGGTFSAGTSTFNFTPGAGAQSIGGANQTAFNNLTINNASGVNLGNSETVGGTLTLTQGILGVGANTLTLNGAVSFASGSFTSSATGTVNYNQSSNGQGIAPGSYGNLTFSNFNKTLPATGTVGVAGTFTTGSAVGHAISNSTFDFNGAGAQTVPAFNYNNLTVSGSRGGAAITLGGGNIGVAGTFTPSATNNTYSSAGNMFVFNGSVTQTLPAFSFNGLTLNNSAGANLGGDVTVNGALTLTAGTLGVGTNTLTLNGTVSATGGGLSSGTTGTVNYNQQSNGQATVLAANYGNLTFSNFNKTLAGSGTIGIAGTFTPGSGAAHTITGSTINFNGASPEMIPGFTYNNLTSSSGATARTLDSVNTIKIAGVFTPGTNVYTVTGSTIEYNGGAAQSLPATFTLYNNLTFNNPTTVTGSPAVLDVNGNLTITQGTFAAGASLVITVAGNWTNNGGTFTPSTGMVTFDGGAGQAIGGTTATTFNNLTNGNANGLAMSFNNTVNGILALTSSDITVAATRTLTQPLAGSSSGTFDVNGRVQRNGFVSGGGALSFGNPFNTIQVTAGAAPANIVVDLVRSVPTGGQGFPTAVQRTYTITPSAAGFTGTLRLHYLPAELNGNNPAALNLWRFDATLPTPGWRPNPATSRDCAAGCTTNNSNFWVERIGVTAFSPWTMNSTNAPTASGGVITGRIVDDQGNPVAGAVVKLSGTQNRKFITDANGYYRFDNVETNGFYTVTPSRANYSFAPSVRSFSQIGESTEAGFAATLSTSNLDNPLDSPEYFVRQHYVDFLNREPDEAAFNFWSDQIVGCGNDQNCIDRKRENVSAAYFLSIEFQQTGGLVDGVYRASYGRQAHYAEFMPDARTVGLGFRVNDDNWETKLAANKIAFVNEFANRAAFHAMYDGMSNSVFVDTLISHTGVSFTASERDALVNGLAIGAMTRGEALQSIAENGRFVTAKFNETFVMMEYFGYLRRDADADGFAFWLGKLNQFGGNFQEAEMVKAFIVSGEFRDRFPR